MRALLKPAVSPSTHDLLPLQCRVLHSLCRRSPFVVELLASFQSRTHVFILTEFVPGGELFNVINLVSVTTNYTFNTGSLRPNKMSNQPCPKLGVSLLFVFSWNKFPNYSG